MFNNKTVKINNVEYECKCCEPGNVGTVENLHVVIEGELKNNKNKLHIDYEGKDYFGHMVIMTHKETNTDMLVYIFQEGDKELS